MSTTQYDSRTADKFVVRLPDGLRAEIEGAAGHLDRSMNSIFIQAARQYLDAQQRQQLLLDTLAELANIKAQAAAFNIDEHVRMAADARRYRWLRDVAFDTPRQDLVPRDRMGNLLIDAGLDGEIDRAMKAYSSEREAEPCEQ
jgi:predicted transcriptional regulator